MLRLAIAMAALAFTLPASAKPVTDCPNRDAPFSAQSPVIDIMLSPAAMAAVDTVQPGLFKALPKFFASTTTPTFSAILTLREMIGLGARFAPDPSKIAAPDMAKFDQALAGVPVTAADRVARCARYDNDVPSFGLPKGKPRLLLFEKINGFKDTPSVNAARAAIVAMAERKGWAVAITDKGGVFNPRSLRAFDAVIWNNISGDVLTLSQRRAFQRYLTGGGAYVAMHGSAGDPVYFWDWYPDTLLGARFMGHPLNPQFQEARIAVDQAHPLAHALPQEWRMTDEWYSFRTNPRAAGAQVLLTLDESTYKQTGPMGMSLSMGADHPLAWTNCIGKGRMFYSAIGHMPETYTQPQHVAMLEAAIGWAAGERKACPVRVKR